MVDEVTVRACLIADLLEAGIDPDKYFDAEGLRRFQIAYEDLRKFVIEWQKSEQSDDK